LSPRTGIEIILRSFAAKLSCVATAKPRCAGELLRPGTELACHGRVYGCTRVIIGGQAASINVHSRQERALGQTQRVLHPSRAVAIGVLCLLSLFAQAPSSSPQTTPGGKGRSRDAVQKGTPPEGSQSEPKRLFERLALQIFPGQSGAATPSADLGASRRLYDLVTILIVVILLQLAALIVQAYYLYKMAGESRRTSHILRDNVKLNRQALEISRQALILNQPPRLKVRSVEVRPRPYAAGEPFNVFPLDTTIECRFLVRNTGGSRATILYSAVTLFVIPHSEPLPMVSPLTGAPPNDPIIPNIQLKPGEFTFGIFVRRTDQEETASVKDLYVIGWVDYVDDVGNLRHTSFCRMFVRGRFVPVNDPDYEDE
jgi:hypothetical protein